ncbi:MAG: prepilin peptidase [Gammaproteobacteria bacterium]|nr:prepilin peptidase [Gammaproteobacteria bacterium]MBI5618520.1 prepilin peptidase [Gammaproteobacteria bacterium]
MALLDLLSTSPLAFTAVMAVLGLVVGSFLNVVIHRLPIMMERALRSECEETFGAGAQTIERFDLVMPRSRCPQCKAPITAVQNVPIVSYVVLGGRCASCRAKISPRYPAVEFVSGIATAAVAWHFGFGSAALFGAVLTWMLIALAAIDFDTQYLPDAITQPGLWLGIIANLFGAFTDLPTSVIGALAGYLSLWCVYWGFKLVTGKEGMGYGDFKLLGMLGAWLGWQQLPLVIVLSSVVGAIIGGSLIFFAGRGRDVPLPFGPFLAIAGWIALLFGPTILHAYLGMGGGL